MTKVDPEQFRQRLLVLRQPVNGDVAHLANEALRTHQEGSGGNSGMPIHIADVGSDSFEQELSLSLLANEEHVLEQIAAALERLDQGTFGRCEECHEEIAKARLKELPYTPYCVTCARKLEQRS